MKISKNPYIWNSIAGVINASQAIILGIVVTRTNGLADAGVLALAFSLGNLFMNVGHFGVRKFQVTDVKNEYSFSDYFSIRVLTVVCMILAYVFYLLFVGRSRDYEFSKIITILMMCSIYAMESVEDVFWGYYQLKNRLDLGGKIFSIRWLCIMGVFSGVLCWKNNLLWASVAGAAVSFIILCISLAITFPAFGEKLTWKLTKHGVGIMKACFPLFLSSFMSYYVTSSPKYAIDKYFNSEVQACYGFVSMPVFVIDLLNMFLYMPILVSMAGEWEKGDLDAFLKRIKRQMLFIIGISVICLLGGYFLGIPVLSILYGVELSEYKGILLLLLGAGAFLAFSGFFVTVLTILRKQFVAMGIYGAAALLAFLFMNPVMHKYGLKGGVIYYILLMAIISVAYLICIFVFITRKRKEKRMAI